MQRHELIQLPDGFRERFFEAAEKKRSVELKIENVFRQAGYSCVLLPTVEYSSVFLQGLGEESFNRIFHFFDHQGNLLALRADPTCSLSRLAATRLAGHPLPYRLYYITSVFRRGEPFAGRLNEFTQAGAELIGVNSGAADFELMSLLASVLTSFPSLDCQIHMSHSGLIDGLLSGMNLDDEAGRAIYGHLRKRDRIGLDRYMETLGLSNEFREILAGWHGLIGGGEVLDQAVALLRDGETSAQSEFPASDDNAFAAVRYLRDFSAKFASPGVGLVFDLDLVKRFDYYTGVIFEVYARGSSHPIGGGGRYDRLLEKFGRPLPAVGFSLVVDRLEDVL